MVAVVSGSGLGLNLTSAFTLGSGVAGNAAFGSSGEKSYINSANGNLILQDRDDLVIGHGFDIATVRTYNSLGVMDAANGNWRIGFYRNIVNFTGTLSQDGSTVTRIDGDGSSAVYRWSSERSLYVTSDGGGAYNTLNFDGIANRWSWTDGSSGATESYDWINGRGRLAMQADRSGNQLTYSYSGDLLSEVAKQDGEKTVLDYVNGKLASVHALDKDGQPHTRTRYVYDDHGRLSSVTVDLTPDDNSIADGKVYITNYTYDGDSQRIASIAQSDGSLLRFDYAESNGTWRVHALRQMVDGVERVTTFDYTDLTNTVPASASVDGSKLSTTVPDIASISAGVDASRLSTSGQQRVDHDVNLDATKLSTVGQQQNAHDVALDGGKLSTTTTVIDNHADNIDSSKQSTAGTRVDTHVLNIDGVRLSSAVTKTVNVHATVDPWGLSTDDPDHKKLVTLDASKLTTRDPAPATAKFMLLAQSLSRDTFTVSPDVSKLPYQWPESGGWARVALDVYGSNVPELVAQLQTRDSYSPGEVISYLPDPLTYYSQPFFVVGSGGNWISIASRLYGSATSGAANALAAAMKNVPLVAGTKLTNLPPSISFAIAAGTTSQPFYKVKAGDTWQSIATTLYGTSDEGAVDMLRLAYTSPTLELDARLTFFPANMTYPTPVPPYYEVLEGGSWERITSDVYSTSDPAAVAALRAALNDPPLTVGAKLTGFPDTLDYTSAETTTVAPYYRVQAGDSWASIAVSLYGVNPGDAAIAGSVLKTVMGNVALTEGAMLADLPATLRYNVTSIITVPPYYTVGAGDTWSTIASTLYGSTTPQAVAALQQAMGNISLANGIQLTGLPPVLAYATSRTETVPAYYTVQQGDSWAGIAQSLYGASDAEAAAALQAAMGNVALAAGAKLSGLPATLHYTTTSSITVPAYYLVQASDSWASVACALYGDGSADAAAALQAAMGNATLAAGVKLAGLPSALHYAATVAITVAPYYTVQSGDSWSSIALSLYHTSDSEAVAMLQAALGAPVLAVGTVLEHLPGKLDYTKTVGTKNVPAYYQVRAGDSWESLTRALYGIGDAGAVAALRSALGNPALNAGGQLGNLPSKVDYSLTVANGVQVRVTDALGNASVFTSDAMGRLAKVQAPASANGASASVAYTYDDAGDVLTQVDGNGAVTRFEYDGFGNQIKVTDALGNITERTFNSGNKLLSEGISFNANVSTAASRHVQNARMVYDSAQRLRFAIDREGGVTEYRCDAKGQCISTITYTGNAYISASQPSESDLANWVANTADKSRASRSDVAYDFRGQVSQVTKWNAIDGNGVGIADGKQSVITYVYNQVGQLLKTIAPDTGSTTLTYDGLGRVLNCIDAAGTVTSTVYDDAGNKSVLRMDNGLLTTSTFNAAGELVSLLQSDGSRTLGESKFWYDADGRLRLTQAADGTKTAIVYDATGRKTGQVDAAGALTEYVYDADNRLVHTVRYAMPVKADLLVPATVDLGLTANHAALDRALGWTLDALRPQAGSQDVASWNVYDALGRLSLQMDGMGYVTQTLYDGTSHAYAVNRLATPIDTAQLGNGIGVKSIALVESANDRKVLQYFDKNGRVRGTINGEGYMTEYRYDAAGRLVETVAYATKVASQNTDPSQGDADLFSGMAPVPQASPADIRSFVYYNDKDQKTGEINGEGYLTEYSYDNNGRLAQTRRYANKALGTISVASPLAALRPQSSLEDQVTLNQWNKLNQLESQTNPDGTISSFTYNSVGALTGTTVAKGSSDERTVLKRYDLQGRVVAELPGSGAALLRGDMSTAQVDAVWTDHAIAYTYDAAGHRTSVRDALGNRSLFFYDDAGRLRMSVNGAGNVVESEYDALGRVSATTVYATAIAADALARLQGGLLSGAADAATTLVQAKQAAAAQNSVTRFAYNADSELIQTISAAGAVDSMSYNAFGEVAASVNAVDNAGHAVTTVHSYDRRGLATTTQAQGQKAYPVVSAQYDAFGRQVRSVDANGNVAQREYDKLGRIVTTTDQMGAQSKTSYDAFGRVLTQTDALSRVTTHSYSIADRSTTLTTPEGISVTTTLTRNGQTQSVKDCNGNVTQYSYDKDGNLLATIGSLASTGADYDAAGQLLKSRDANGNEVSYTYDGAHRMLTQTVNIAGVNLVTRYTYDGKGQRVSVTDANGVVTRTDYDLAGQVMTQTVDPAGAHLTTSYTHDVRGNTLTVTSAGGTTMQYVYDELGRRIKTISDPNGLKLTQVFSYDDQGNVTGSLDALDSLTRYAYEADGRLVFTIDPLGYVSKNEYDAAGRVTAVTRFAKQLNLGGVAESLTVAQVSALVGTATAQDQVQYHVYDKDGRLFYDVDAMGGVTRYGYDGDGNIVLRRTFAARIDLSKWTPGTEPAVAADDLRDGVQRMLFDALNRPLYTIDGKGGVVEMKYDSVGNVLERVVYANAIPSSTDATVTAVRAALAQAADASRDSHVRNVYDSANRLQWTVDSMGQVTGFNYDGDGNVVKKVVYASRIAAGAAPSSVVAGEGDRVTLSAYDSANRLAFRVDESGTASKLEYDANSNVVKFTTYAKALPRPIASSVAPTGAQADAAHDRVTRKVFDALNREIYSIDGIGAVVETRYDSNGRAVEKITYANTIPLATIASAAAVSTALANVANANRDERTRNRYDLDGRMQWSVDASGAVTQLSYDNNGNLVKRQTYADPLTPAALALLATDVNAIPAVVGASCMTQYVYDADNRLVFTIDPLGAVSEKRYDVNGNVIETVRYAIPVAMTADAPALSALKSALHPDGTKDVHQFQRYDKNGRLAWSVDATGAVTRLVYDAKGNVLSRIAYNTALSPTAMAGLTADPTLLPAPGNDAAITNYVYDADDRLVFTINPLGAASESRYDSNGNVIEAVRYATSIGANAAQIDATSTLNVAKVRQLLQADPVKDIHQRNRYDSNGRLTWSVDALGAVTERRYDAAGNLVKTVAYANGLAGTLADSAVPQVSATAVAGGAYILSSALDHVTDYAYDADGRLVSQTDGAGTAAASTQSWAYDSIGNVIRHTDGRGNNSWSAYDASNRLVRQIDAAGIVTVRSYFADGRVKSETSYSNPVALPAGQNDTWAYDAASTPAANADPIKGDQTKSWTYDSAGRVQTSTDAAGIVTLNAYDAFGNLTDTTVAYGTGAAATLHRTFDRASRVTSETRAFGTTDAFATQYTYDTWGNQLLITAGGLTTYQYFDALGRKTGVQDAEHGFTTTTYNTFGDIVKVTDARGNAGYFYSDALGRVTMQVDPEGSVSETRYDLQGHVVNVIRYANKVQGAVSETVRPQVLAQAGSGVFVVQTPSDQNQQSFFDALGRKTEERTWYSATSYYTESFTYDANGNKKTSTARNAAVTSYEYDNNNRLITETLPVTSKNAANADVAVQNRLEYDARGNVVKKTEAYGLPEQRVTTYVFDKLNRAVKEIGDPITTFDAGTGREVAVTPTKERKYDLRGNLIEETDARGARTLHFYDLANRESGRIDPLGTYTRFTYDSAGQKASQTIYASPVQVVGGGAISNAVAPAVLAVASALPGSGAYLRVDAANDRTTNYTYDGVGRLKTTSIDGIATGTFNTATNHFVVGSGTVRTQSFYDATGNVVKTIDANGNITRNYYDRAGRLMARLDAKRYLTVYQFDAFGNVDTQATYANAIASNVVVDDSTSLQQLTLIASADDRITKFTYDRMGRTATESRQNVAYAAVNATNGSLSESSGAATTAYEYDGLSNVTKRTDANGAVTDWKYDSLGRKTEELQASFVDYRQVAVRTTTDYEYDGLNNVAREIVRGENNSSEADDRITRYFHGKGGFLIGQTDAANAHLDYRIDAAGNITKKTLVGRINADGQRTDDVTLYQYDAMGREVRHTDSSTGTVAETRYNAFGEITGKRTNPQPGSTDWAEFTDYDQTGHAWRSNAGDGITHVFVHDANGNTTLKLDDAVTDLHDTAQKSWTLLGALNLADTNQFYSVYDARNQLSDTFQPSMDGSHNIITVEESLTEKQGTSFAGLGGITMGVAPGLISATAALWPTATGSVTISPALSAAVTLTDRYTVLTKYYEGSSLRSASHTLTVNLPDTSAWGSGAVRVDISIPQAGPAMGYQGSYYPTAGAPSLTIDEPIDWENAETIGGGRVFTITIYKESTSGLVVLGTQSLQRPAPGNGSATVSTSIATSGTTVRFTDQRPDTQRLILMTRPSGSNGGWTINNVPKALVNGTPQDGSFSFDWSGMARTSYEFRYVCINGINDVVNSQQGTMVLTDGRLSISQNSHTMRGPGRAFVDTNGNIVFNELGGQAMSLTVSYRPAGSTGGWSTQVLSPSNIGGSLPGWFTFATGGLGGGTYEYVIDAKNVSGTSINKSSSTFVVGAPNSVSDPSGVSVQSSPAANVVITSVGAEALQVIFSRTLNVDQDFRYDPPVITAHNPINSLSLQFPDTSELGNGNLRVAVTLNPSSSDVGGYSGFNGSVIVPYGTTSKTLTLPETAYGAGGDDSTWFSYTIFKQTAYGEVQIASYQGQGDPGDNWTWPMTGINLVTFDFQSNGAQATQMYMQYQRRPGSGWTTIPIPPLYINGIAVPGHFATDWTTWPAGFYDYRTVALDAAGNLLQSSGGTMDMSGMAKPVVTPGPNDLIGGAGRVFMDTAGNLVFTEQSFATDTLTIRYRGKDSAGLWSTRTIVPRASVPGWFVYAPPTDAPSDCEYVIEARTRDGQLLNKVAGTFTKGAQNANLVSPLSGYSEPPVMTHFTSQPASTATVRLSYRPKGVGAYTTVNLTKITTGMFDWASGSVFSSDTVNADYDFSFESLDSNGILVNKAFGVITLGRDPKLVSYTNDSMPTMASFNAPSGNPVAAMATTMVLRYRLLGNTGPFNTTELWRGANGAFVWDASNLIPPGTSGAVDYNYTLKNGDTVLKRDDGADIAIDGTLYLGPTNGDAQLKWIASGTVNSSALIHHAQTTNAFGEVVSETNARNYTTVSAYNTLGKLVRKEDPNVSVTLSNGYQQNVTPRTYYYYDLAGRTVASRDANGNLTSQALLGGGTAVAAEFHADGGSKVSGFNVFGEPVYSADEIGLRTDYSYDQDGRLTLIRRPQHSNGSREEVHMTYDEAGNRITQAATPDADSSLASYTNKTYYDSLGRVAKVVTPAGRSSTYSYVWDSAIKSTGGRMVGGWRQTVADPTGRTLIDDIDAYGRTTAHTDLGGHTFVYNFNNAGWITSQSGSSGQNIAYTYYANGYVRSIRDVALQTETTYEYDSAGNRTYESYQRTVSGVVEYLENASIDYDSNNRVTRIRDPRSDIEYEYDAVGNRRRVHSMYHDGASGAPQTQDYWYDYDNMNRFIVTMGKLSSAGGARATSATDISIKIVLGDRGGEGVQVYYNKAGQRIMIVAARDGHREDYTYGAEGYLEDTYINADASVRGARASSRVNDWLGRTTGYYEYSGGNVSYQRNTVYTTDGRQKSQTGTDGTTTYYYYTVHFGNGEDSLVGISSDGAGELAKVQTVKEGAATITTVTAYDYWDEAKQRSLTVNGEAPYKTDTVWRPGVSSFAYDVNGHLTKAVDMVGGVTFNYITNGQGLVLRREQFKGNTVGMVHRYMYLNGSMVGDVGNDGDSHLDYAQTLARLKVSREEMYKSWQPVSSADFDQNYQAITREYPAATGSSYTVKAGDSLYSIAGAVWGDVSMWYLIADANGLTAESELSAGQTLVIPNKVTNIHNNSSTFRPYNAGEIIGDTNPTLPDAPPPAPPPGQDGCGGLAQIVMIVVAVVATVMTAGAAAAALSTTLGELTFGQALVVGAVSGATGSLASQTAGVAMGVQDSINWKGVAMGALSGAATLGVAAEFDAVGSTGILSGNSWPAVAGRAVLANVATQATANLAGLQKGFNWRSVAVSAISAPITSAFTSEIQHSDWYSANPNLGLLATSSATAVVSAATRLAVVGGRMDWGAVAVDAIGNAIGSSLAAQMQGGGNQGGPQDDKLLTDRDLNKILKDNGIQSGYVTKFSPGAFDGPGSNEGDYYNSLQKWRQENPSGLALPLPVVEITGSKPTYVEWMANKFSTTPERMGGVLGRGDDDLLDFRLRQSQYYRDAEGEATNPVSRELWHLGGLASQSGNNFASAVRGLSRIATNYGDARSTALANLKYGWDNLPRIMEGQADRFRNMSARERIDAGISFGLDSAAMWGGGKVVGVTGGLALDAGSATLKWSIPKLSATAKGFGQWLAPEVGKLLESYMYRTGALAYAVEPGMASLIPEGLRGSGKVLAENMGGVPEGYQAHHLVMSSLAKESDALHYLARNGLYDVNRATNGLGLPGDEFLALADDMPLHNGFHGAEYRNAVGEGLNRLDAAFQTGASDSNLLMRVGRLEQSLSKRLLNGDLWLNGRDAQLRNLGPFEQK